MSYLGFTIIRMPGMWAAVRRGVSLKAKTLPTVKKYVRAIHAAERTGIIR